MDYISKLLETILLWPENMNEIEKIIEKSMIVRKYLYEIMIIETMQPWSKKKR